MLRWLVPICVLAACEPEPPAAAMFAIPGESVGDDFYALPFPNDLRRSDDGTIDLSLFPTNSMLVDKFRDAADHLDGFGMNSPVFVRFTDDLDPSLLPDPAGTLADDASIYLVDVDPESPTRGTKTPLVLHYKPNGTETIGPHALVARPYPGFGLTDGTTYALVVTNRTIDIYGDRVRRSGEFDTLIKGGGGNANILHAREVYQPLFDYLDQDGGDERADVMVAAVFTTQHAVEIGAALRAGVFGTPPPTATTMIRGAIDLPEMIDYQGEYAAPNFQSGEVPYRDTGGEIIVENGVAKVVRMENMRFAITIPRSAMPQAGYPIAIYSHGTGGDFRSFIDDGTAFRLAQQGIATISTDQVLHGPRNPGGDAQIDFFNFNNPFAARDNALQGAADAWSQMRLALTLTFADQPTIKLDPSKIYFFGHSQGSSTGPAFVAYEPALSGAVLSGAAGQLTVSLLNKTLPLDIPSLLASLVRDDPVDADNPSIGLLQMWMERTDPVNFAPLMVRKPVAGAKNIFQTEGFVDHYTPNIGIEAMASALGNDIAMVPDTTMFDGAKLRNAKLLATPITDNAGAVTNVLAQYKQKPGSDGHFVVFDIELARQQSAQFLGSLARTGKATVVSE